MKSKLIKTVLVAITLFAFAIPVYALRIEQFESTLSLGIGAYLRGTTYEFPAGINGIQIAVQKLVTDRTHKTNKLNVRYVEDGSNYSKLIGQKTFSTSTPTSYKREWGQLSAGKRYYEFSTKIDGESYAGLTSTEVLMYVDWSN